MLFLKIIYSFRGHDTHSYQCGQKLWDDPAKRPGVYRERIPPRQGPLGADRVGVRGAALRGGGERAVRARVGKRR